MPISADDFKPISADDFKFFYIYDTRRVLNDGGANGPVNALISFSFSHNIQGSQKASDMILGDVLSAPFSSIFVPPECRA